MCLRPFTIDFLTKPNARFINDLIQIFLLISIFFGGGKMRAFLCVAFSLMCINTSALADGGVDTSEELSFGFGLNSSPNSLLDWDNQLTIDYWLSDVMAFGGSVALNHQSFTQGDAATSSTILDIDTMLTHVLSAGEKTRLTIGGGLGIQYYVSDDGNNDTLEGSPMTVTIPAQISLEHFFTTTISLGLNARFNLYRTEVDDDEDNDTDDATHS